MSPVSVKVMGTFFKNWKRDEIKDIPDKYVESILDNKDFSLVKTKNIKKSLKKTVPKKVITPIVEEVFGQSVITNDYKKEINEKESDLE